MSWILVVFALGWELFAIFDRRCKDYQEAAYSQRAAIIAMLLALYLEGLK